MASTILSDNGVSSGVAGIKTSADSTGALALQTTTSGGTATTAITVDTSQNVGIGTASPTSSSVLDVVSGGNTFPRVRSSIGSSAALFFQNSDTGTTTSDGMYVGITSAEEGVIWNNENTDLRIATNNTERMRIASDGAVVIGKTVVDDTTEGFAYRASKYLMLVRDGAPALSLKRLTDNGEIAQFYRIGTQVGSISVTASATAYNTSSDYRLKENIAPMTGALAKVALLKPVTYKWKVDGSDGEGFIAHELAEIKPDCVSGEKDAVDAEGNPQYQGIDVSFLVATLTAAIQELKAINDTQAETLSQQATLINALTARIEALEAK